MQPTTNNKREALFIIKTYPRTGNPEPLNLYTKERIMGIIINEVDKVEILTLQDNYIDIVSGDSNDIIQRAAPVRDGELKNSIFAEHGFSALVTVTSGGEMKSLLFDFGLSESGAAQNAETLDAELAAIEAMALSHGHRDHTGGLEALVGLVGREGVKLVLHPAAFKSPRYVKINEDIKVFFPAFTREMIKAAGLDLIESKGPYPFLDDTVLFLGEIPRETDFELGMPNAYFEENGEEKWDPIEDDTSVVLNLRGKGLIILSGCAHSGIVNTTKYAKNATGIDNVHAVMGGFHLSGPHFESFIDVTTEAIKEIDPDYIIPTHCTGRNAINHMEQEMPDKFLLNMAGTKMTFEA